MRAGGTANKDYSSAYGWCPDVVGTSIEAMLLRYLCCRGPEVPAHRVKASAVGEGAASGHVSWAEKTKLPFAAA